MRQITVAIAGLGSRGLDAYARFQERAPEQMRIVAVADPRTERVEYAKERYHVPDSGCFDSAESLFAREKLADAAFICTMDRQHFGHARAALEKGYDILLEKPVSPVLAECEELEQLAARLGRKVIVCHVLRYTPFYQKLWELLSQGEIGELVSIQAIEKVRYWHQAHSFVRGNWRNCEETSPMILQKYCHDMDVLLWLSGRRCVTVSSMGGLTHFRPENAPEGATKRCMECPLRETCLYSAPKFYLGELERGNNDWPVNVLCENPTPEKVLKILQTGPYGRCVYHCDNDVVDHQVVQMTLEGGVTVSFTMCAFTAQGGREIRLMGTRGEIDGDMAKNRIVVAPFGGEERVIDLTELEVDWNGHGGGDEGIVRDLLSLLRGERVDQSRITTLAHSMESHAVCLAAEKSRLMDGQSVRL